jgi:hypothetical protein
VITADSNFPTMLALHGAATPSVAHLRHINELTGPEQAALLVANLPTVLDDLEHRGHLLNRTTTADSSLARCALRVSPASPAGRNSRWSSPAHRMHTGPSSRMSSRSPVPVQAEHVHSLTGEMTTRSGGRLLHLARRSRRAGDSCGDTQCVR